jgi:purine nucleoside permease
MKAQTACLTFAACLLLARGAPAQQTGDITAGSHTPIRVVVVTTFNTGDNNTYPVKGLGEFKNWADKFPLPEVLPFPQGYADLHYNPDLHVLGLIAGEGPTHMAASITALANDSRFDFSHAYWLLAGIAGIDPNAGPAGSASWANFIVDGDLAYEIDAREIPPGWSTGYIPLGRISPYQLPRPHASSLNGVNLFPLNAGLANWAYQISNAKVTLPDDSNLQALRAEYTNYPLTQSPPKILRGTTLAAGTFWIGALLNTWAENWVTYWTEGKGTFVMTSEEDAGYMQALTFLNQAHTIDLTRVMDLRGGSDFDLPPAGQTPAELLASEANATSYSAFFESLDNVYLTGSSVAYELARHWNLYRDTVPSSP